MDPFLLGGHIYGALYSSYKWSIRNDFGHSAQHCWAFEKHAVDLCYSLLTSICTYVWSLMSYVCSSVNVICLFVYVCVCVCLFLYVLLVSCRHHSYCCVFIMSPSPSHLSSLYLLVLGHLLLSQSIICNLKEHSCDGALPLCNYSE